jgi:rhomboid protease GluP
METVIRATDNMREAQEWALVLAAAEIPHRLEVGDRRWTVLVATPDAPRATAALDAYDAEVPRDEPTGPADPAAAPVSWGVGLAAGASLLAFFAVTGPPAAAGGWFVRGGASAPRIAAGELWRAVTALTLHVDAGHVAGNAVATALLLTAVVQRLGPGIGLWLTLLAGASANVLEALVTDGHHEAVGASTATFGAIGILAGLQLVPTTRKRRTRRRWIVFAAAIVLLAMLGVGRGSDALGHALGLGCGGVLGLVDGILQRYPVGGSVQWTLVAVATLTVVGCWMLALA